MTKGGAATHWVFCESAYRIYMSDLMKSKKVSQLLYVDIFCSIQYLYFCIAVGASNQFFAFYYRNERVLMQPQFMRDDLIALSVLQENAVIESGAPYIIDTKSIGFIFRNVYERGDKYECKVLNPKSKLEDINIEKAM